MGKANVNAIANAKLGATPQAIKQLAAKGKMEACAAGKKQ